MNSSTERTNLKPADTAVQKSLSPMQQFFLTLLAVVTGLPIGLLISGILLAIPLFAFGMFISLIIGASAGSSVAGPKPYEYEYKAGNPASLNRLVSVPVNGPIVSQSSASDPLSSIFGVQFTDGERVKEQLQALAADQTVKGVILEIDSPGGMINASKAISDGVSAVRDAKKPVIAHVNGYGASGAYWAASSTDYITAEQGSLIGSVGVILGDVPYFANITRIGELETQTPIRIRSFSAGRSKDLGNPFREISADEAAFLNQTLQREYDQFANYVSQRRNIEVATLKNNIGALAYDTTEATRLKLLDEQMNKESAYKELAARARLGDDYVVQKELTYGGFFDSFFGVLKRQQRPNATGKTISTEARGRYCDKLAATPLTLHGSLSTFCKQ